jgi:tellurite resistance protein
MIVMTAPAVKAFPLNYFGIAFGLAGLAGTWTAASDALEINRAAANVLWLVAFVVWLVSLARYFRGARTPKQVLTDLEHPVLGPFASLVTTTGMLYGAALSHYAPTAGRVVVLVMFVLGLAVATLFFTRLLVRQRDIDQLHAGYLLPTVAAGLIGGQSLATVGLPELGYGSFGVGILMWLLLGAALLGRLAFRPALPAALVPTLAIFAAPPAVGGNAWFALEGRPDLFQHALLGTFVLLILTQLALIPTYARLPFGLGFWALTFTTAASGTYGIHWLAATGVPGADVLTVVVLVLVTAMIGWIAAQSVRLVLSGAGRLPRRPRPVHGRTPRSPGREPAPAGRARSATE